jgi:hypothetical protein
LKEKLRRHLLGDSALKKSFLAFSKSLTNLEKVLVFINHLLPHIEGSDIGRNLMRKREKTASDTCGSKRGVTFGSKS